ncbi:MAG TPA: choice-of-anchor J domain-containing protein [bacterium]|jgi:hypothetical protein
MWLIAVLLLAALNTGAFALKPVPSNPLATVPTYMDQQGTGRTEGNRVIDSRDGHLQCVGQLSEGPYSGTSEQAARAFLAAHTDWVGLQPSTENLKAVRTAETPMGYHVTFEHMINGVPVYPGDVVVTLSRQNKVLFYYSGLMTVPEKLPTAIALSATDAVSIAHNHLQPKAQPRDDAQTRLVIWAGDNRDFAVCWKVNQFMSDPRGDWEVLVDANTGQIRRAVDKLCYVDGTGLVFRPDPLTTAQATYGQTGYTDGNDANTAQLFAQEFVDTLRDITLTSGTYYLRGPWCYDDDWDPPTSPINTATNPDSFRFNRNAQGFEDVNVYYNIDKSQRWIISLGFNNIQHAPIHADPHGVNGDDNSYYVPSTNRLAWGEGGVDDAEDADVIWHEYGHAIQNGSVPGWGNGDEGGMGEGFGDYWAGSYSNSISTFHNTWVFNWDGHNEWWSGRVLNANYHYPENNGEVHDAGMIWSQPCFETMLDVGRDVMDKIVLQHHFLLGTSATMPTAAQALLTADMSLFGGVHQASIYTHFIPRGLLTAPPVFALTSPNGGDFWPVDSTMSVRWTTGSLGGNVMIELSRSGVAGPWSTLAASVANNGLYTVVVPGPRSTTCRVRISVVGDPTHADTSAADFTISALQLVLSENFESGATGWTHASAGGTWIDQWNLSTQRSHSATHAYKCGDTGTGNYGNLNDARLTSPVMSNLPAGAVFSYWHRIQSELSGTYADSAYDGGIIEVSVNGGTFTRIAPLTGYPKTFRYRSSGGNPATGPMLGQPCFAGVDTVWSQKSFDLSAYAGQNVQIRFRFGSDAGTGQQGWFVDDVQVYAPMAASLSIPVELTCASDGTDIMLRWSGTAAHYKVYSSLSADGPFTQIYTTDQTTITISDPTNMMQFFMVTAWDGN